jgi:NAD(P)H-flavin reductase
VTTVDIGTLDVPTVSAVGTLTRVATIRRVVQETPDTFTYWMTFDDPGDRAAYRFLPGQFNMLYLFGIGEVPISVASDTEMAGRIAHTIRSTGRVTDAFRGLKAGDQVGVRGPFGRPWPMRVPREGNLMIVAGGLGLAPLRAAIYQAIRHRGQFRRVLVLVGARGPEHMLYRKELDTWIKSARTLGLETLLTVDEADADWPYDEGVVTTLFPKITIDPASTTAFVCGPEIMMHFALKGLKEMGFANEHVWVSMERNMHCGIKVCGHCQIGPKFMCADGPVFRYDEVVDLMEVREL